MDYGKSDTSYFSNSSYNVLLHGKKKYLIFFKKIIVKSSIRHYYIGRKFL